MTRDAMTNLCIRQTILRDEASRLRDARDMEAAAKVEAELRDVNLEILKRGRGNG